MSILIRSFLISTFVLVAFSACRPQFNLPVDRQEGASEYLCQCLDSITPNFGEDALDLLEYAVDHTEGDLIDRYIEKKQTELTGTALETFTRDVQFFLDHDIDDFFITCGEPLLERYPELDEMEDETLVDMFLYNLDDDECRLAHLLVTAYKVNNG